MEAETEEIVVRMTPAQKASIAETAKVLGVSVDEFVRMAVIDLGSAPGASVWSALLDRYEASLDAAIRSIDETVEGARQSRIRMAEFERAGR
ncbi:MAG TPA: hypothetical protein VFT37_01670 [Telluria sp.]|nr:hypothetical protein [Telluria sp.]